jgi:hypothetical protein
MITLDQKVTQDFTTHDPVTGSVQNADIIPTCEIFADDTDTPIMTPVVVNRVGFTGIYRITFVASTANGFAYGSNYNVDVVATVNGITARATILVFNLEKENTPKAVFNL